MKLQSLSDRQLLQQTQQLVQNERELLGEILNHLKEVERRKLFSDLGYSSLFDYCLRELKYSEAQTGRRLSALKLIRELPQVEEQIASGALNLTHICQAQSFFKHMQRAGSRKLCKDKGMGSKGDPCLGANKGSGLSSGKSQGKHPSEKQDMAPCSGQGMDSSRNSLSKEEKLQVLNEIAHKSSRETQALLMDKTAQAGLALPLPQERERVLSKEHSEFRLIVSQELRQRLEEVRSLLGPKALGMTLAELIGAMAELSLEALMDKKFGRRRSGTADNKTTSDSVTAISGSLVAKRRKVPTAPAKLCIEAQGDRPGVRSPVPRSQTHHQAADGPQNLHSQTKKPRSISKSQRWQIWQRDGGRCGHCNLREGIKSFGPTQMRRSL